MKRMILLGLTGLILFGLSAGGSWFLMQTNANSEDPSEPATNQTAGASQALRAPSSESDGILPVAFQPDDMSVESLIRVVSSIKSREAALDTRAAMIQQREERLNLVLADLEKEKNEIVELHTSLDTKISRVEELVQQVNRNPSGDRTENRKDGMDNVQSDEINEKNIPKLAAWIKSLPEEDAAATIRSFVNDGKIGLVAKIMLKLEEKDAGKILGALKEPPLITTIADAVLREKTKEKPPN